MQEITNIEQILLSIKFGRRFLLLEYASIIMRE